MKLDMLRRLLLDKLADRIGAGHVLPLGHVPTAGRQPGARATFDDIDRLTVGYGGIVGLGEPCYDILVFSGKGG